MWSGMCLADLAPGKSFEPESALSVLASFFSLPVSLFSLAIALKFKKGLPRLRQISIVTSAVALSLPIVAILLFQGMVAARNRHFEKLSADIRAERLRNRPGGTWKSQRRLTNPQMASLVQDLSALKGHKLKIACLPGDEESAVFANDFAEVFKRAGWLVLDGGEIQLERHEGKFEGLHIDISPSDGPKGRPPSSADSEAVVNALIHAGVQEPRYVYRYGGVPSGWMMLNIGRNRPKGPDD